MTRDGCRLRFHSLLTVFALALVSPSARAQLSSGTDVNTAQKGGADTECAISKNPANPLQLFASCNTATAGLFAARSTDGGVTWVYPDASDRTIADGDAGQGPAACCDPTTAWDTFGNLYLTYLNSAVSAVVTLLSTDGGATFTTLATFSGSVDQPTVVAANTTAAGAPVAVWVVWNQSNQMVARGAAVTGLGAVGAFGALQTIPGTGSCSFGDIAIAPNGAVVQACQNPTGGQGPGTIRVNTDADGLGAGNFGAAVAATTTNVGGFDFIPAQNTRSVDSEAGLAFDNNPASPRFGRLYLVYTEETANENHDLDVMLRFSDNNGGTWSAPIRVNDDPAAPIRSQFLPKIAVDDTSGDVLVCWHDCRNSGTNIAMQEFCASVSPTSATPTFTANAQVGDGASVSNNDGMDFGDYSGLDYFSGVAHPIWGDTSNSTANNPNGTANFDAYTDRVSVAGATAPQIQVPGSPDLGMACSGTRQRGSLNVCNTGKADLTVDPITSSNPLFSVSIPSSGFPVLISPDFCFPFEIVFQPSSSGTQSASLSIPSNDPAHAVTTVQVVAAGSDADIRVTGSTAFGVTSAWSPAEKVVSVCNTGGCSLSVSAASVSCPDFAFPDNPFPAAVGAGSCLDLGVEFTPTVPGPRTCTLTIASNDPDTPTISRSLTARTPPFLTLHAGLVDPQGTLASSVDTGATFTLGFVNPFAARWAWDLRLGRSSFDGLGGLPDTDVWTVLADVKFTLNPAAPLRVFVNAGLGIYAFDPGDVEGGFNLGLGLNIPAGRRFEFEGSYNYHNAVTAAPDLKFSQFQLGLLISF